MAWENKMREGNMPPNIQYTALEKLQYPKPVDRLSYIEQTVKGKRVLDLGAYDETAFNRKDKEFWLHGRLSQTATNVLGIDNSDAIPPEGIQTSKNSKIIKGNVFNLNNDIDLQTIDILVAGELIEHLSDTLSFLSNLRSEKSLRSKTLILSTPNAACLSNVLLGIWGRENNHHDHLQIYSYKTLNTLFLRAGFQDWTLQPYHEVYPEMINTSKGLKKKATMLFQKGIHVGEYLLPLLSGGWIAQIKI